MRIFEDLRSCLNMTTIWVGINFHQIISSENTSKSRSLQKAQTKGYKFRDYLPI